MRSRRPVRCFLMAASLLACSPPPSPGSRELQELERLAFVPPARCLLVEVSPPPFADRSMDRAIVFDRFEFTRGDLAHYWPDREARARALAWQSDLARDAPERSDWPAMLDFHEARELAALRGMRLPTPREWTHVAVGRRDFAVPWGGRGAELWANTRDMAPQSTTLRSPTPVGTFENGKSRPFACYDLLGNVWEWVDGVVPGIESSSDLDLADELDDALGSETCVMGGAFDSAQVSTWWLDSTNRRTLRFHARKIDKRTLSPSIGARMCADAEAYLLSHAARWGADGDARRRVRSVGGRWSEDALARAALGEILDRLLAEADPDALRPLGWLREGVVGSP
jgi:hypothetical protein